MLSEVKKCADNNDIRGLHYIFLDSLDVDPTFENYKEDFLYCEHLSGFFDDYVELNGIILDKTKWTMEYWEKLKLDLMKNFSEKRFKHMIDVAKIVYADKIERLMLERKTRDAVQKKPDFDVRKTDIEELDGEKENKIVVDETKVVEENSLSHTASTSADRQQQNKEAKEKTLESYNRQVKNEERKEQEIFETLRRAEEAKKQKENVDRVSSKKIIGVAIPIIAVVAIIGVIILVKRL